MQKKFQNLFKHGTKFGAVLNLQLTLLLNKTQFRAPESRFLAFPLDCRLRVQPDIKATNEQQIMPLTLSKNVLPFKSSSCGGASLSLKVAPRGYPGNDSSKKLGIGVTN